MLNSMSAFFFGHTIDINNRLLPFNDGSAKNAILSIGDYSLTEFVVEVQRALNAASAITFTVSVDRATRLITIAGDSNFELNTTSGAVGNCYSLLGFSGSDKTGTNTYTGTVASGSSFLPQLKLQKFVDFNDEQVSAYSNVAKSGNGTTQTVSFGVEKFMTCEIAFQTNNNTTGSVIENQPNGLDNLRTFLEYAVNKRKLEFIPDRDSPNLFTKCIIESTNVSGDGTGFKLVEYLGSTPGFFSSGKLRFRRML